MLHRLAASLPGLLLLLAALAPAPALAKEGMQARLDAPIPADTPPGTTIEVGWSTVVPDGQGGTVAFSGAPVFIALRSPGASEPASLVFGDEFPAGSGHFTASIVVPDGGIAWDGVTIGLRGESCQDGACTRNDLAFELVGEVLSTAPSVAPVGSAAVTVASAAPARVAAKPAAAETAATEGYRSLLAIGIGSAIVAGLAAAAIARRRFRVGEATGPAGAAR